MTISSITVPKVYHYNTDNATSEFVLGNNALGTFKRDLTSSAGFSTAATFHICAEGLVRFTTSEHVFVNEKTSAQGLERIRLRQPDVIRRAKELRAVLGDPLIELARILQDIPVEDDVWDRIVQEPYG